MYKIGIVILHFGRWADTLECLTSLEKLSYPHFEVILVDNGSQEPCPIPLPNVILVKNARNLGFAEGNNRGILEALRRGAEFVLLLNNDTVVDPNLLEAFVASARRHPNAGVFGAKIYYYDDPLRIWHAGGEINTSTYRCFHLGCPDSDLEKKWEEERLITYACGCALFVRKEAIERVGMMAPEFFLLWEEIDWCFRMRQAGFDCLFVPGAKVWHKISQAFEGGNRGLQWQYYYFRNRLLFLKRHLSLKQRWHFYLSRFPKEVAEMVASNLNPRLSASTRALNRAALRGIRDYFLNNF